MGLPPQRSWGVLPEDLSLRCFSSPGHEAAFAAFLCCLCKIGVLRVDDQVAIVFKVFDR